MAEINTLHDYDIPIVTAVEFSSLLVIAGIITILLYKLCNFNAYTETLKHAMCIMDFVIIQDISQVIYCTSSSLLYIPCPCNDVTVRMRPKSIRSSSNMTILQL